MRVRLRLAPSVLAVLLGSSASCATTVAPCDTLTGPGDQVCGVPGWEERGYLVHLPPTFDARKSTPVLLALHGGAGDKEKMQTLSCATGQLGDASCLDSLADREGVVVVYPDGTSSALLEGLRTWNAGGGERGLRCVSGPACRDRVDDVVYFGRLLDELERLMAVDTARVYVTGFSNGAAMAHRLGCELSSRIAAVAAVSGANQLAAAQGCTPPRAVPVLSIHGEADPCWAFEGGFAACLQEDEDRYVGVRASVAEWARHNGCGGAPVVEALDDVDPTDGTRVFREVWPGCRAPVELLRIEGGGHAWPGGHQYLAPRTIGVASRDLVASEVVWAFLSAQVRRD